MSRSIKRNQNQNMPNGAMTLVAIEYFFLVEHIIDCKCDMMYFLMCLSNILYIVFVLLFCSELVFYCFSQWLKPIMDYIRSYKILFTSIHAHFLEKTL